MGLLFQLGGVGGWLEIWRVKLILTQVVVEGEVGVELGNFKIKRQHEKIKTTSFKRKYLAQAITFVVSNVSPYRNTKGYIYEIIQVLRQHARWRGSCVCLSLHPLGVGTVLMEVPGTPIRAFFCSNLT